MTTRFRKSIWLAALIVFGFSQLLHSQAWRVRVFPGFLKVRMGDVNNKMQEQIRIFSEISELPIPGPSDFNGDRIYGFQLNYHANENYFFNAGLYWYDEKVATEYRTVLLQAPVEFQFTREVELVNLVLGLQYYFNYQDWRRVNTYLFSDLGIAFASSHSLTRTRKLPNYPDTNTRGDFSNNSLTFQVGLGVDLKANRYLSFWLQGGYLFANVGEMDGDIQLIDGSRTRTTTSSQFDYSGILLMAGLAIGLPI